MSGETSSVLPSVVVLGAVALAALLLTLGRGFTEEGARRSGNAARLALVVILLQAVHFAEELETGFEARFPALLGLGPMPRSFFVLFNVGWLAIWILSAWGLAARRRAAMLPLWFLGIACVVNGFAHPALAVLTGGYFPGLVTAPVVGALGFLLVRRLLGITRPVGVSLDGA